MSQFPADPSRSNAFASNEADPFDELARLINGDPEPAVAPVQRSAVPAPVVGDDYDIQAAMEGRAPSAPAMPVFEPVPAPVAAVPSGGVHPIPSRGPLARVAREATAPESPLETVFDLSALRAAFDTQPTAPVEPILSETSAASAPAPELAVAAPIAPPIDFAPMPAAHVPPTDRAEIIEPPLEFAAAPIEPAPAMFADMQTLMDAEAASEAATALPAADFEIDLEEELAAALMSDLSEVARQEAASLREPTAAEPVTEFAPALAAAPVASDERRSYPPARDGKRRAMAMTAALFLMGGTSAIAWTALGEGGSAEAPVILAEAAVAKVRPDDVGGAAIPNQDTELFKAGAKPHQDALRSGTEKPVEVATVTRSPKVKTEIRRALPPTARKVRTVVVKPDGTIVSGERVVGNVEPRVVRSVPVAPKVDDAPVRTVSTVPTTTPPATLEAPEWGEPAKAEAPKTVVKKPEAVVEPKPVEAPKPEKTLARKSDYVVQISSRRSAQSARSAFAKLQKRYRSVLGDRSAEYQKTEIAGKGTFYRVRVLADSKSDAKKVCGSLKRAGGSCFVTR